MKRYSFVLKVKKERIAEYKETHREVWPEMLEALKRNGIHNHSLFLREDGLLFGYMETSVEPRAAMAGMHEEAINVRWQQYMAPFFESVSGERPDDMLVEIEEVFHMA